MSLVARKMSMRNTWGGGESGSIYPDADSGTWDPTSMQGSWQDVDDDPDSPDGNWVTRPSTQNTNLTDVQFEMAAPASTPSGTGQELRVLLRKADQDGTPLATGSDPVLDVSVDNTIVISNYTILDVSSVVASGTFNASIVTDWDNADVRIRQSSHGGGSPGARRYVEVGAVEINWVN